MTKRGSAVVLLLIDVINHFEYPEAQKMLIQALPIAPRIARLKARARAAGIPVIYVNDNFGQWRSDLAKLLAYCLRPRALGRQFVDQIRPDKDDYFILKPRHSAFYQTPLEVLLAIWVPRHWFCAVSLPTAALFARPMMPRCVISTSSFRQIARRL
jgi:nicotinamidase-related amidase